MVKPVIQTDNSLLRERSQEISVSEIKSSEILVLKKNLIDTLLTQPGVAISAVQIGIALRLCVVFIQGRPERDIKPYGPKYFFNPEILERSNKEAVLYEGCLSVDAAGVFAKVPRSADIKIRYLDEDGSEVIEKLSGFKARILLHEVDHMEGKLFTDLVDSSALIPESEYRANTQTHNS